MQKIPIIMLMGVMSACAQEPTPVRLAAQEPPPKEVSEDYVLGELERVNGISDPDSLAAVFRTWNRELGPHTPAYVTQSDTLASIYAVFRAVFKPHDLLALGDWEWGNRLNAGCGYVIVQKSISYSIGPDEKNEDRIEVQDFRPVVDIPADSVLYFNESYGKAIDRYLGVESTELGEGGIMNPSYPKGESEKRYRRIRSFIPILHGHWGGYWHIETHPYIELIRFDPAMKSAEVLFRVGYQGGVAHLIRNGDQWRITDAKATWIE